jgi:hypothetical protein
MPRAFEALTSLCVQLSSAASNCSSSEVSQVSEVPWFMQPSHLFPFASAGMRL